MTDGQIKYQSLVEERRHNLELERYNAQQVKIGEKNAMVKMREQALSELYYPREVTAKEQQARASLIQAQASSTQAGAAILNSIGNTMKGAASIASLFA